MMRTLNAQLLKAFPILRECLPMRLSNPIYFLPYVGNSRCWEYFSRKIFFMPFQVPIEPGRIEKSHAFATPFKEKEANQLNMFFVNSIQFHANANHMKLNSYDQNCAHKVSRSIRSVSKSKQK
jgi:hypothetical protein